MIYIIIALTIFTTDTFIKKYIEDNKSFGESEEILKGNIIINKHHNRGAMFNFLEKKTEVVLALSGIMLGGLMLIFAMLLPKKGNRLLKLGLALTIGGASSNIFDRITKGYVVDYFSFKKIKNVIFNISDIFIFIGSIIMALMGSFQKK